MDGEELVFKELNTGDLLGGLFDIQANKHTDVDRLKETLRENNAIAGNPYHARLVFEKDKDAAQINENKGDGKNYGVSFVLEEMQNEQEYSTFMWLTIFTVSFGFLLILFLKKLKKLTHGAEDHEHEIKE